MMNFRARAVGGHNAQRAHVVRAAARAARARGDARRLSRRQGVQWRTRTRPCLGRAGEEVNAVNYQLYHS